MTYKERLKFITACRANRESYQEIGDKLNISKQRVQQLCDKYKIFKGPKVEPTPYEEKVKQKLLAKRQIVNSCWEYTGCKSTTGYGRTCYQGVYAYVHRVSYSVFVGKIPNDMCVLHRCDNPKCFNPEHLWVGTHQDNMLDRDIKGRTYKKK